MDALDLLEQQHRDVLGLIGRVASERRVGARSALVMRLVRVIEANARIKERFLYPLCAERMPSSRAPLYEAYESLALTRFAALKLARTRATHVRFEARLKLLGDLFDRSTGQEEDWMFPKAKRERTDEELDALGERLERAFRLLLEMSGPRAPRSGP